MAGLDVTAAGNSQLPCLLQRTSKVNALIISVSVIKDSEQAQEFHYTFVILLGGCEARAAIPEPPRSFQSWSSGDFDPLKFRLILRRQTPVSRAIYDQFPVCGIRQKRIWLSIGEVNPGKNRKTFVAAAVYLPLFAHVGIF